MIRLGIDRLVDDGAGLLERPLAVICNDAARDGRGRPLREILEEAGADVRVYFAPEHGMGADLPPGEVFPSSPARGTRRPVYCAYEAEQGGFAPDRLHGAEVLLFDLPMVGCRYYTYLHVLERAIDFAGRVKRPLWVLDRPNPIRGDRFSGPLPHGDFKSMVAAVDLPVRYGLTTGEVAEHLAAGLGQAVDLTVLTMEGWSRSRWYDELELPWTAPSPNMRDLETAMLYPGTCLLEGVELNEGRGTEAPFRQVGAPWLRPRELGRRLEDRGIEGLRWHMVDFVPAAGARLAGERCRGLRFEVVDREVLAPLRFGMELLAALRHVHGQAFAWTPAKEGGLFVDRLMGSSRLRDRIDGDGRLEDLWEEFRNEARRFRETTRSRWLYREDRR